MDIITNGTCIDSQVVSKLQRAFSKDYDDIQISLDGQDTYNLVNRGIGSDVIFNGIKLLNDAGIIPRINCVVTKDNHLGILDFIKYINNNFMISSLSFNTPIGCCFQNLILDDNIAEELYRNIMNLRDDLSFSIFGTTINSEPDCDNYSYSDTTYMRCTAMRSKVCIAANGDVYPCVFMEKKIPPLGNILHDDLQEIWKSEKSEMFVQSLIQQNEKCCNCINSRYCPQKCAGRKII